MISALAPFAFAPSSGRPLAVRPTLRSRPVAMSDACTDNVCYALASAKPESVEKLSTEKLQQQVDLLELRTLERSLNEFKYKEEQVGQEEQDLRALELEQQKVRSSQWPRPSVTSGQGVSCDQWPRGEL